MASAPSMTTRERQEATSRPGQNTAEFMERRGRRIVETTGCLWHSVERRFFMSVPYHLPQNPDPHEVSRLLSSERAIGVRFLALHRHGLPSGLYVCRRKEYDLTSIHQKQRSVVRRGLEKFTIRPVEDSELLCQGLQLNRDTMARQGRYDPEFGEEARWRRLVRAVRASSGVAAYGAFSEGRLAAYVIACRDGGWLHLMHQMSRTDDLPHSPNHALTFTVTKWAAEDPTLEASSYGVVSLVSTEGLHLYKVRFGYEIVERTCCFQFHPVLAPLLRSRALAGAVHMLRRVRPQDQRLEKVESVLNGAILAGRPVPADRVETLAHPGEQKS